jgi:hypothetical protein
MGAADAEIAKARDKTLMGYVGAQRLLSPGYTARYEQLAAWLQEYNDHPDAPAIYKLASVAPHTGRGRPYAASFVGSTPGSPSFAAARTVTGADAAAPPSCARACNVWPMWRRQNAPSPCSTKKRRSPLLVAGPEVELCRPHPDPSLEADSQARMQSRSSSARRR